MLDVPLPDTYAVYQYISHSSYSSLLWLVYFASHGYCGWFILLLMVTVVGLFCFSWLLWLVYFASHSYCGYRNYRISALALLLLPQQ